MPKPMPKRRRNVPPDSMPDETDALPDDLRRRDPRRAPPDSLPDEDNEELPVAGHETAEDGNNPQHPVHDDHPTDDFTPGDYEREIDDTARDRRRRRRGEKPVMDRD